jgi:uncharacterized membrane protein YgcG
MRAFLSAVLSFLAALACAQAFVVKNFDANISLREDGVVDVIEKIDVHFNEERHGIFRFIPTSLPNANGSTRAVFVSSISTGDDPSKISSEGPNLKIRLGDPDKTFDAGTDHTYEIRYSVKNAINWFDEADSWKPYAELYWNVTGEQWETYIEHATVLVSFPPVTRDSDVRAKAFVGAYGSTEAITAASAGPGVRDPSLGMQMSLTKNSLQVERSGALQTGEGLTVVLDVPYAAINQPSTGEKIWMFLTPNMGFALPLFALLLGWIGFVKFGKDPAAGPMVVQFDPPDDMSGPEAGAMLDERVDQRDLVAGVVSLAVKGYLLIETTETGTVFKHTGATLRLTGKTPGPDLGSFELKLLTVLSGGGPVITETDMREVVAPNVSDLRSTLYQCLVDRGYYLSSPETARIAFGVVGVILVALLGLLFMAISPLHNSLPSIVGGVISLPIVFLFAYLAPRRTPQGAKTWALLRGFEEFMRRAREPELEWLARVQPDQALFEKYLPHAIAFGLTQQWSKAFQDIALQTPSWYVSPYGGPFNPIYFGNDLFGVSNAMSSAAFTPPRSSGASGGSSGFSSGGGFSGGGFGGGGGGSW